MKTFLRDTKWGWPALALVAALAVGGVTTGFGLTNGAQPPLWTEQSAITAAAPTVQAPDWVKIGRELKPAVVNVSAKRAETAMPEMQGPSGEETPFDRYFKDFFGSRPKRHARSMGSGFIINQNGYIVTNNHVVEGASQVQVKLSDGRELPAKVIGRDSKTDIALLKVEASGLSVIPLGDSSASQVGEPVMAIGNPFGLEQTVTTGIVSATGRAIGAGPYDDFIQTDASINPGNSGGPLINARGQAIGINTAIFSQSGGSVGIGFAIPMTLAKSVVTQLADSGKVTRGWLGVGIQSVTSDLAKSFGRAETTGVLVSSVSEGSPAERAGLKSGDIITEYDGRKVERAADLPRGVAGTPVGREVRLSVVRDGMPMTLTAKIAALDAKEPGQADSGEKTKPALGLAVQPLTPALAQQLGVRATQGLVVQNVQEGSPAAEAGFERGDVIVEVDKKPIKSVAELRESVDKRAKGKPMLFRIQRQDASLFLTVTV
ncbi:MAG TPA: DegQ family serine endoprotease [Methylomirabilota bacterium]|nr:DegQ family serine endoprotease [Methylomirabilota bacterium]